MRGFLSHKVKHCYFRQRIRCMNYDTINISKLDTKTIGVFEIYREFGTGVMEDPFYIEEKGVKEVAQCSEFEAWLICAYKNLMQHGPMLKRSSWESPNYRFRKLS